MKGEMAKFLVVAIVSLHGFCGLAQEQQPSITIFEATGYSEEFKLGGGECAEVPHKMSPIKGSVTAHGCVMVYERRRCKGYSIKVESKSVSVNGYTWPKNYTLGSQSDERPSFGVRSFRSCSSNTDGGTPINVDIFLENRGWDCLWTSVKNLCGCRNMPMFLMEDDDKISLNNHGNEIYAYDQENCSGKMEVIPAGSNPQSEERFRKMWKIRSFHPGNNTAYLKNCIQLHATVYNIEILDPEDEATGTVEQVELATQKDFVNQGAATQTATYRVDKQIKDSVGITIASGLESMTTIGGSVGASVTTKVNIPLISESEVKVELKASYEKSWGSAQSRQTKDVVTHIKSIKMTQDIEIPPCTKYTVSATMSHVRNQVIWYKVFTKITAELDGKKVPAKLIREHVSPDLEILSDFDQFTVVAVAKGKMTGEHELNSRISGKGERIPNCDYRSRG